LSKKSPTQARLRPIDKALFAAGCQSPKRLWLEYHEPASLPPLTPNRLMLAEVGAELVKLARAAFQKGAAVAGENFEQRAAATTAALAEKKPQVLFEAAFRHEDLEVETDILLTSSAGTIDLYEVKSGNKVKSRHLLDVAFQVFVIEAAGHKVRAANILHLNPNYAHHTEDPRAAPDYPVQKLFKSVDASAKVRRMLPRVQSLLQRFRLWLQDDKVRSHPVSLACRQPFPCPFLATCLAQEPPHPLVELPDLTVEQEATLRAAGAHSLSQLDPRQPGLTLVQRRAVRSVREARPVIEPTIVQELKAAQGNLHFVDLQQALFVMPVYEGTYPWQHIPFQWTVTTLRNDGTTDRRQWQADGKEDPRAPFANALADLVREDGTLVFWGPDLEERLRELLEATPEQKPGLRMLLHRPGLDLQHAVRVGAYHKDFHGSFDLNRVLTAFGTKFEGEIADDESASLAFHKLRTARRRNTKLCEALAAYGIARSEGMAGLFRTLTT
jgi:hypothetical protein